MPVKWLLSAYFSTVSFWPRPAYHLHRNLPVWTAGWHWQRSLKPSHW